MLNFSFNVSVFFFLTYNFLSNFEMNPFHFYCNLSFRFGFLIAFDLCFISKDEKRERETNQTGCISFYCLLIISPTHYIVDVVFLTFWSSFFLFLYCTRKGNLHAFINVIINSSGNAYAFALCIPNDIWLVIIAQQKQHQ